MFKKLIDRWRPLAWLLLLGAVVVVSLRLGREAAPAGDGPRPEDLFAERRSDVWVDVEGSVARVLPDDLVGSPHQRFVLRLPSGHTLLVSHNLALAERVPLEVGDPVGLRGEYEWNERGGVVHWTHHDPRGERPGGWIRHRGKEYR